MAANTKIDCGGWSYTFFCEQRKKWKAEGFSSNIQSGTSTIFAEEKDVLAKFPELTDRVFKAGNKTFAEEIIEAIKEERKLLT